MNGLMSWMEKYILLVVMKIGLEKYLVVLRDVFIGMMLVMMVGVIVVLLNVFMWDFLNMYLGEGNVIMIFFILVIGVNGLIWNGILVIMVVVFVLLLGVNLVKVYEVDFVLGSIVFLVVFIIGLFDVVIVVLILFEKFL